MGVQERREREKEQRRQAILDAAEAMFFSQGIAATSMDQIADAAELSKGTLYLYFSNKEDMIAGICERALLSLKSRFEQAVTDVPTGAQQLEAVGRAYFAFAEEEKHYFDMMMLCLSTGQETGEPTPHQMACQQTGLEIHQITASAIENGIRDGSMRTRKNPMELALLMWGQTTGVIQIVQQNREHLQSQFQINTDHIIEHYFELVRNGLTREEDH